MSSSRRRPWPAALAALAACAVLTAPAAPGHAQSIGPDPEDPAPGDDAASVRLTVTALTGVLGPGSIRPDPDIDPRDLPEPPDDLELRVVVENDGDRPLDALRLVVELHPPTVSRAELHAALNGAPRTVPDHVHDPPVGDEGLLGVGEVVGLADGFSGDEVDWADGPGGVHPVRIAVVRGTTVLAEVVTAVVYLRELPADPLHLSLLYPIDEPPWRTSGGAYPGGVDRAIQPGGRLDRLLRALERHPDAPVVLAPAAHLLEDLADRGDGFVSLERTDEGVLEGRRVSPDGAAAEQSRSTLDRIRAISATLPLEPVASGYANADLSALAAGPSPLPELAAEAAADGRRRLQRTLGRTVDPATYVLGGPIEPAILDLVPGEVVVVPYPATTGPELDTLPDPGQPVRGVRTPAGRLLTGIVADPFLHASLAEPDLSAGPLVAGHRVLAETAAAYLAEPGRADRALLALPPLTWDAEPRVLDALLTGVAAATWLRPGPPGELALTARRDPTDIALRAPSQGGFPTTFATALGAATRDLEAARAALPPDTSTIAGRTYADLRDQLLRASSRWWRSGRSAEAEALVRDVERATTESFGVIDVSAASVTLTSDAGQVPVTLQRSRGGPITVQVEAASQGRLLFPEGPRSEQLVLEEGASQTVTFPVQALSTGTFPVTIRVTDPDGARELARATLSVRSTTISRPALAVLGAAILVLLLLGALRRGNRPAPPPQLELVREAGDDPPEAGPTRPPPDRDVP